MAAQPQKQIKVLRIGVIQDGKIVQEKRIGAGKSVTIGGAPKATFSFPLPQIPRKFPLFVAKGNRYALRFLPSMKGKIAGKDGVLTFEQLQKKGAAQKKGDAWLIPLNDKSRGKISVGNLTILFQFVPAPPEPLNPTYNTNFRPKLMDEDDPVFVGFLGLFSILAAVFSVYVSNVEPPETNFEEIPDRFVKLALDPETPNDAQDDESDEDVEELDGPGTEISKAKEEAETSSSEAKPESESKPKTAEELAAAEIERKKQMEAEVMESSLLLKMIGTRGESSSGAVVEDLLGEGGAGTDLDDALASVGGVEVGTQDSLDVKKGTGAGTDRSDESIGDLAQAKGGSSDVGSGPSTKVTGSVGAGAVDVVGGDPGKVKSVVKGYQGQVKACYEGRLKANPNLSGRVEVIWNIANGRVTNASVFSNTTGDAELGRCIVNKIRLWRFPRDLEDDMEVVYPFILSPG